MSQNLVGLILESQMAFYIFSGVFTFVQQAVFAIAQISPWLTKKKSQAMISVTTLVNEFRLVCWAFRTEVGVICDFW